MASSRMHGRSHARDDLAASVVGLNRGVNEHGAAGTGDAEKTRNDAANGDAGVTHGSGCGGRFADIALMLLRPSDSSP